MAKTKWTCALILGLYTASLGAAPKVAGKPGRTISRKLPPPVIKQHQRYTKQELHYSKGFTTPSGYPIPEAFLSSLDTRIIYCESLIKRIDAFSKIFNAPSFAFSITQKMTGINAYTAQTNPLSDTKSYFSPLTSYGPSADQGVKDKVAMLTFTGNILKQLVMFPSYLLSERALRMKYNIDQSELYTKIANAMFAYVGARAKLEIADRRLASMKVHARNTMARFNSGAVNKIALRQAEENLSTAQHKQVEAVIEVKVAESELRNYSKDIDFDYLNTLSISLVDLHVQDEIDSEINRLPEVLYARAEARSDRLASSTSAIASFLPSLVIEGTVHGNAPKDSEFNIGVRFDIGLDAICNFSRANCKHKLAALQYKKTRDQAGRKLQIAIKEVALNHGSIEAQNLSCNLRRAILELARAREIRDPEKHYADILRYEGEVYKAEEEIIKTKLQLVKSYLTVMHLRGKLVPNNAQLNKLIAKDSYKYNCGPSENKQFI